MLQEVTAGHVDFGLRGRAAPPLVEPGEGHCLYIIIVVVLYCSAIAMYELYILYVDTILFIVTAADDVVVTVRL